MNRERLKELLPIIKAYANGDEIQYIDSEDVWSDDIEFDPFEHKHLKYRIKPKAREFWLCSFTDKPDSRDYCVYPTGEYTEHHVDHFEYYIKVREVL